MKKKEFTFEDSLRESLKDPEFKKVWEESQVEYQVMEGIVEARKRIQMSQNSLSRKTGISQADLSRIENGGFNPSVRTLKRIASALNCRLDISFTPIEKS